MKNHSSSPPKIKSYRKYTQIISGRHDREEKQTIIPEAFPNLESIYGKGGGKGTQPLWVKGFRSCFNRLHDIRAVRQKSWSGVSTWNPSPGLETLDSGTLEDQQRSVSGACSPDPHVAVGGAFGSCSISEERTRLPSRVSTPAFQCAHGYVHVL